MDENKFYRMVYIGNDDMADVIAQTMGWENHSQFHNDVGDTLVDYWHVLGETEHNAPPNGYMVELPIVCIIDGRSYGGNVNAIVTDYGVYVNVGDYMDATS